GGTQGGVGGWLGCGPMGAPSWPPARERSPRPDDGEACMKLGIFLMGSKDSSYFDIIDQVVEADALGFDGVWLAERHFASGDLLWPSPMLAAAYLAASTRRIRIGLAARGLPFHHPLPVRPAAAPLGAPRGGRRDPRGSP